MDRLCYKVNQKLSKEEVEKTRRKNNKGPLAKDSDSRIRPRISKFDSYAPLNDSIDSLYLDTHNKEKY